MFAHALGMQQKLRLRGCAATQREGEGTYTVSEAGCTSAGFKKRVVKSLPRCHCLRVLLPGGCLMPAGIRDGLVVTGTAGRTERALF